MVRTPGQDRGSSDEPTPSDLVPGFVAPIHPVVDPTRFGARETQVTEIVGEINESIHFRLKLKDELRDGYIICGLPDEMTRFFYSCERVRLIVRVEIHAELEFVLFFDRENASARKGSEKSERERSDETK